MKGISWKVNIQFIVSSEMQLGSRLSYQIISAVFLNHEKNRVYIHHNTTSKKSPVFIKKKKQLSDIKATGKMLRR